MSSETQDARLETESQRIVLQSLACPKCGGKLPEVTLDDNPPVALSFNDCLRKCEKCDAVGASNGRDPRAVTYIYKNPVEAIPEQSRPGAEAAVRNALNKRNRPSKLKRFGYMPTSEDAVTWVVFTHLLKAGHLRAALAAIGVDGASETGTPPTLLLWGVPVGSEEAGLAFAAQLRGLCFSLGEKAQSLSEPDVVVDLGGGRTVFIEVKHRSGNDFKPSDYKNWTKYVSEPKLGWSPDAVIASGCYELARNWRLAYGLSQGTDYHLVNLGPPSLFSGIEGDRLDRFVTALGSSSQERFHRATWDGLLESVWSDAPVWFKKFCVEWGVTSKAQ